MVNNSNSPTNKELYELAKKANNVKSPPPSNLAKKVSKANNSPTMKKKGASPASPQAFLQLTRGNKKPKTNANTSPRNNSQQNTKTIGGLQRLPINKNK
jgi:hypothetical protein|uniref:Uncharacterized protein n=1 Tax=viral metagenome TaxID=1070528 RepID=A0A6C0CE88_9ZZZZ